MSSKEMATMTAGAGTFLRVAKRQLHCSPTNPRKDFPEEPLKELAASIREHGVIQPLIARRWPEKDRLEEPAYEIVCGERRFRSGDRAGLEEYPVIVREFSDTEVVEIQLIENLQREDVSAYDEAVGYGQLLELKGPDGALLYTVERIAEKIGKKVGYVRNRLKIRGIPTALLSALKAGKVGLRVCEIIGRIPHRKDREACAAKVLNPQWGEEMTAEEVQDLVHEEFMMPLASAPFDRGDADLVKGAGSCEGCRFRSGNDPDLEADLAGGSSEKRGVGGRTRGIDPQLCTNPQCYRAKCDALLSRAEDRTPELVIGEAEARTLFDDYGNLKHTSKLRPAEKKPGHQDTGHWNEGKVKPWGEYARKLGVPVRLVKNPKTGAVLQLVDSSAVKEAERREAKEGKSVFVKKGGDGEAKKAKEKERERQEVDRERQRIAMDRLSGALVGNVDRELLLTILALAVDNTGIDLMTRWTGVKAAPDPKAGVRAGKVAAIVAMARGDAERYDREAILILILMGLLSEGLYYGGFSGSGFWQLAKAHGVDMKECEAAAKELVRGRKKGKETGAKIEKRGGKEETGGAEESRSGGGTRVEVSLESQVEAAVIRLARSSGSVVVTWGKIREVIGLPDDDEGTRRAMVVEQAMKQQGMIAKGVLNRVSPAVKAILEVDPEEHPPHPEGAEAVRAASEYYDEQAGACSIAEAAAHFSVPKKALENYRSNAPRLAAKKAARKAAREA